MSLDHVGVARFSLRRSHPLHYLDSVRLETGLKFVLPDKLLLIDLVTFLESDMLYLPVIILPLLFCLLFSAFLDCLVDNIHL